MGGRKPAVLRLGLTPELKPATRLSRHTQVNGSKFPDLKALVRQGDAKGVRVGWYQINCIWPATQLPPTPGCRPQPQLPRPTYGCS